MGGFKLIAITPLLNCNSDFRKNLEVGTPYKFYNNYLIEIDSESKRLLKVRKKQSVIPSDLYKLKNGIDVSICAVIGKNGSGKSTLFELLYYMAYVLVIEKRNLPNKILPYSQILINKGKELSKDYSILSKIIGHTRGQSEKDYKLDLRVLNTLGYNTIAAFLIMLINKHDLNIDIKKSKSDLDSAKKIWSEIGFQEALTRKLVDEEIVKENKLKQQLNLSVLYENKTGIFEVEYLNGVFSVYKYDPEKEKIADSFKLFNISDFFYNIAINYSHHSLNSTTLGNWVSQLFHKNDAYITPLVINPMREEGNFNINHELSLSKERLMSNIIFDIVNDKEFKLLGKYKVSKFIFTPKVLSPYPLNYGIKFTEDDTLNSILIKGLGINKIEKYIDYWDFAIAYLEKKLKRINDNYFFLINSNDKSSDPLRDFILNDSTHITKKIRQTLNFLKSTLTKQNSNIWKVPDGTVRIGLKTEDYLKWLTSFKLPLNELKPSELIEYALPGFFSVDFELETDLGETVPFGKLSSGEQQMILNTNALLYHLYNLQSVHTKRNRTLRFNSNRAISRIKYKDVNIILDEIELYYHPDMQRQLVKSILDSFENIKQINETGIGCINICFLSHSPFILSDIPRENVLLMGGQLKQGNSSQETFGANIHFILANEFFMENGFIGEFSKSKISEVIEFLNKNEEEVTDNEFENIKAIINLIGEPVIKSKLLRSLQEKFPIMFTYGDDLNKRILAQEDLLRKLKKQRKNNPNETNR